MKNITIDGKSLSLQQIAQVAYDYEGAVKVVLSAAAKKNITRTRQFIEKKATQDKPIYGVNTGFGSLSDVRIPKNRLDELQVNLLRSHAAGVGRPLKTSEVRASILLRANTLASGVSGVSIELIEALLELLNRGVHPYIPEQGSVGACGDLAPLAHLALTLIGEGRAYYRGELLPSSFALKNAKLKPYKIKAKEGLSLINGTQIMTAIGVLAFLKAEALGFMANLAGAMTVEALAGSAKPFDQRIHAVRPHRGQRHVAGEMRRYLKNSAIMKSHANCSRVQDPYSVRCIPQVHGICLETIERTREVLEIEVNSVTDNPLVFLDTGEILSGGNFHGEYVGMAMDHLSIAIAELANISEQRLQKMINPGFSGLPAYLIEDGGVNSGFMIVQCVAASLVSENKVLSHPAVVDSIPTSVDKEDHVSMGTIAARKARQIIDNTWNVIAIEFLAAAQALEFRKPLQPAVLVAEAMKRIRTKVPMAKADRIFHDDINAVSALMLKGELLL